MLYSFAGGTDGGSPYAGLIQDSAGNLYGTTEQGGDDNCSAPVGCGVVFKLALNGTENVLHTFTDRPDGTFPFASLIADKMGNLYGTTEGGGNGYGTVFKVTSDGTETVLYAFAFGNDAANPRARLLKDKAGNLYGTTPQGGADHAGAIFKVAPDGGETLLYSFTGGNDGAGPSAGLIADRAGNLYGTTTAGGVHFFGTVFTLAPDGTETVLHAFSGSDGWGPEGSLISDRIGNLYGTTYTGGIGTCNSGDGCGTVFKLAPDGTEVILRAFSGGRDGAEPAANLLRGVTGELYGTASSGGAHGFGTIFEVRK